MKTFERILIKLAVIQFLFLLVFQFLFHKLEIFPEINQITKYEGVSGNTYTEILETFQGK